MQNTRKIRSRMAIVCLAALCLLILLAALMPYVDDDWDWGTQGGLDRLSEGFADYNGRYLGNLLVLLLTRAPLLKALIVGAGFFLIAYLPARQAKRGSAGVFLFSLTLLLLMPTDMLGQTMAWASGFANYGAGTALLLLAASLLTPVWEGEDLPLRRAPALFALGLCGSLFMEHVTLCLLAMSLCVLLYASLRARRVQAALLLFFAGAVLGTILMFSNGGYRAVGAAQDPYRAFLLPGGQNPLLYYSGEYASRIRPHLFDHNLPILLLLTGTALSFASRRGGRMPRLCAMTLLLCVAYLCVRAVNPDWSPLAAYTAHFDNLVSLTLAAALFGLALCAGNVPRRRRMVFTLLCVLLLTAPLFVVRPINARNFLPMYALEIAFAMDLLVEAGLEALLPRLRAPLCAVLCVLFCFLFSVYGKDFSASRERAAYARAQAQSGASFAYLPRLPYERPYTWAATPGDSELTHAFYRAFYGLPEGFELRVVDYDEWYVIRRLEPERVATLTREELSAWMMEEAGIALGE